MASLEPFEYVPLQMPKTEIRLLKLYAASSGQAVECSLQNWSDIEAPPYYAVSYTWGMSRLDGATSQIIINKKQKMVQKNCFDALQQLKYFQPSQYYWLDALCINQDNVYEKNHQVAKMGQIYRNAQHVIVCLGQYSDDAEYSFNVLSQRVRRTGTSKPGSGVKLKPERILKSLQDLANRPYFGRVWTVQEFILGRSVTLYCGFSQLEVHRSLSSMIDALAYTAAVKSRSSTILGSLKLNKLQELLQLRRNFWERDQWSNWSLQHVSSVYAGLKCHDLRDYVYGMLGLVDWVSDSRIEADYSKSRYDLAAECALILEGDFREAGITRAIAPLLSRMQITVLDRQMDSLDGDFGWLRKEMKEENYKIFLFFTESNTTKEMIGVPMYGIQISEIKEPFLERPDDVCNIDWIICSKQYNEFIVVRIDYNYDNLRRWEILGRATFKEELGRQLSFISFTRGREFITWFGGTDFQQYRDGAMLGKCYTLQSSYVVDVSRKPFSAFEFFVPQKTDWNTV